MKYNVKSIEEWCQALNALCQYDNRIVLVWSRCNGIEVNIAVTPGSVSFLDSAPLFYLWFLSFWWQHEKLICFSRYIFSSHNFNSTKYKLGDLSSICSYFCLFKLTLVDSELSFLLAYNLCQSLKKIFRGSKILTCKIYNNN